ncbi:tol-pal system YbgF family protein [Acidobacteriota bacterium]
MYYLALAYYESGELDKARDEFEEITISPIGRLSYGDLYPKSFYMLGIINEQQGDKIQAADYYEQFLDLWKDADADIAELADARERVASLKNQ